MSASKRISQSALAVLSGMEFDGNIARITSGQLDRKLYDEVNKALEALGGKWNRGHRGHVFPSDPSALVDEVIDAGGYVAPVDQKKALGFFETPAHIAERVVRAAGVEPGMRVLEPSAGHGALLVPLPGAIDLFACDIAPGRRERLVATCDRFEAFHVHIGDFLALLSGPVIGEFDAVVMNPPFARQADIDHITHAFRFLRPGGRLASVASAGVGYRQGARARAFREFVAANGGEIVPLPDGAFQSSGTDVSTVLVTMRRAA